MSVLTDLETKAKTALMNADADVKAYVAGLESKARANLPLAIICGLLGMVVGALGMWLKSKL
jgi:TRAP-type uncharacterized transport system fused permease subunit